MKFQGTRLAAIFAALPLLFFLIQCGAGTAIEQQALNTGESITLKFDGPFTYQYTVEGKDVPVVHKSSTEDEIQLLNNYSDNDPQDNLEESLIAHAGITYDNKLSIILGPDAKLVGDNGQKPVPDGWDENYKKVAVITNAKHPEDGELSFDGALEFSKNLVGISTVRKEVVCVNGSGQEVPSFNNTKMPNLVCPAGASMKPTGKTLTFDYTVDQIKQLMGSPVAPKNNFIYVWHKGDPLTLTLKNDKNPILLNPAVLGSIGKGNGNYPIVYFPNLTPSSPGSGGATPGNPPNSGNADNGAPTGGSNADVPVDSKGGDSNVAGQQITTGGSNAVQGGGKGCSLGGESTPTFASAAGIFFALNLFSLVLFRRGVTAREKT